MICLGSLYNTAKKKMQLFVSQSVALSLGPAHSQVHFHSKYQGLHCCRKLLVMGELGNIPLEDAHPHAALGNAQLRETQVRFGVSELRRREGAGRSWASDPTLCPCSGVPRAARAMPWVAYHEGTAPF